MALKNLTCKGKITNTGSLGIIDKGFCYSLTTTYPTLADSVWSVTDAVDPNGNYKGTITGLTQATYYYVNAYAINSMGVSYSAADQIVWIKTTGIVYFPIISVSITNNGIPQTVYEMGTSSNLVVSGETIKWDETLFTNGYLNQISSPPPPGSNTIMNWTGYQSTYITTPNSNPPPTNITVNFSPIALDQGSWFMRQEAYYNCGSPQYTINSTITIDAVFPFLWVLKSGYQGQQYFNPTVMVGNSYFYYEASVAPNPTTPFNGKLIEKMGDKTIWVTPDNNDHKILVIGYPASYGIIQYSGSTTGGWVNATLQNTLVSTGSGGAQFGIVTPWPTCSYYVLQYQFHNYSNVPIPFYIHFPPPVLV